MGLAPLHDLNYEFQRSKHVDFGFFRSFNENDLFSILLFNI